MVSFTQVFVHELKLTNASNDDDTINDKVIPLYHHNFVCGNIKTDLGHCLKVLLSIQICKGLRSRPSNLDPALFSNLINISPGLH